MHFGTSNGVSTSRKINLLLMNSIYLLFFFSSLKTHTDQNKKFCSTRSFTLSEKKATHKSSKIAAAKKAFLIGATCFDESFLFPVITGRH